MTALRSLMTGDHRHCDDLFVYAEQVAAAGDWEKAAAAFAAFGTALERHLAAEETRLFPAFEAATGMRTGPTQVMRNEHQELRALLGDVAYAVAGHDSEGVRGYCETLLIMMQQHNLKEENILYPLCDERLAPSAEALASELRAALAAA